MMFPFNASNSNPLNSQLFPETPLTLLEHPLFEHYQVAVWMKRLDLNDSLIQGNKWIKLQPNILHAQSIGKTGIMTFGGAYSNHIAATAAAGACSGLKTLGIIRGDELHQQPHKWSHTLQQAQQHGMQLEFVSRQEYKQRYEASYLAKIAAQYPDYWLVPEGGSNALAITGFKSLVHEITAQCPNWSHLFTAVGTGGTLAGLSCYAQNSQMIMGVNALKGMASLPADIEQLRHANGVNTLYTKAANWQLLEHYHHGGYAKLSPELLRFQDWFEKTFNIELDPVYTNKMVFAFFDQLQSRCIPAGSQVILLHTGGLQGKSPPKTT